MPTVQGLKTAGLKVFKQFLIYLDLLPIKAGITYFLLNSVFLFFIATKYVELIPSLIWETHFYYLLLSLFSHFLFLAFIPFFLIYLPLVFTRKNEKIVGGIIAFFVTLGLILVAIDAYIFSLYRFHINSYVLEQLFGPDASQVFEFTVTQYIMVILLFVVLYLAEVFLFRFSVRLAIKVKPLYILVILCFWLISFLSVFLFRTYSLAKGDRVVEAVERHYPLCLSFDTNRVLSLFSDDVSQTKIEVDFFNKEYNYPKQPLQTMSGKKNLLIIAFDSWRAVTLDSLCAPNIYRFSKKASTFTKHYSGSNGTRTGLFSMFYGLPGIYFRDFCKDSIPSVLMEEFEKQNYDIQLFPSASLRNPPMDKCLFSTYANQCNSSQGTSAWERDENLARRFLNYLDNRSDTVPFFSFLFFDSLHSMIMPEGYKGLFQPSWRFAQYEKLGKGTDPTEFYNLYKNMVYYLDVIVGRIFDELEQKGLLENTIVILTGDHSQEFDDNQCAYWGHNGNYSKAQLHVPFVYYDKTKQPHRYTHWSSHYDIVPTLMEEMFSVKNPSSDYSIGSNLFKENNREFLLVDSYIGFGWINSNGSITQLRYDGTYQSMDSVLNECYDCPIDQGMYENVLAVIERFYLD